MSIEDKKQLVWYLYPGYRNKEFEIVRLEDMNADYFTLRELQRGFGGIIIGDDGTYLTCGSLYPLSYYIEEFKKGNVRKALKINEKYIFDENELINLIKEGINPLEYIRNKDDINFISYAITKDTQSIDPFWDDMANILLKAIINYILSSREEDKSLKRCLEISELGLNKVELSNLFYSLDDTETISLFKQIESAPDKTYKSIVDTLNEKLSKLIK